MFSKYIKIIYCALFILVLPTVSVAQKIPGYTQLLKSGDNNINFGVNKIVNTFLFTGNADVFYELGIGFLSLEQKYSGTALRSTETAFRDDESLIMNYILPLSDNFVFIAKQKWLFSSDTRSIGINELERLNFLAGLKYLVPEYGDVEISGGIENNTQINIKTSGAVYQFAGKLNKIQFYDFNFENSFGGEFVTLDEKRKNTDFVYSARLNRFYDLYNTLNIDLNYKILNRDFLSPIYSSGSVSQSEYSSQAREESRLGANINLDFSFSEKIVAGVDFSYNSLSVERSYMEGAPERSETNVIRLLDENVLNFSSELSYISDDIKQNFRLSFNSRTEDSEIEEKYDINDIDKKEIADRENQRDNLSTRTMLSASTFWKPVKNDTFLLDMSFSLFQYDTPSENNNDDRDELNTSLKAVYIHRFSSLTHARISTELRMRHLVFLKSDRSSMNNWNRILRFNPRIFYKGERVSFSPGFEVLANYTVYDYADISPNIKSLSFRQIKYEDSVYIKIEPKYYLYANLSARYFERGALFWKSFTESPQNSNFEGFVQIILNYTPSEFIHIGSGARYYYLKQKNLTSASSYGSEMFIRSWAPEVIIEAQFESGNRISFNGWYEFQRDMENNLNHIPNFFILAKILL